MMVTIETLKAAHLAFKNVEDHVLRRKLLAVEQVIRSASHNTFQLRQARFTAESWGGQLLGTSDLIKAGDRVQLSNTGVNDGLYTSTEVRNGVTILDGRLFDHPSNRLTKVYYPADVIEGAINLLVWEINNRDKVGVHTEQISRYRVTYFDVDVTHVNGYPASLLGFLTPYRRAQI